MPRRLAHSAILVMLLMLALGGCGSSSVPKNALVMTATGFAQNTITIRAGEQVTFVDPSKGGARHTLYFGNVGQFIANRNGPSELNNAKGVQFNPGDSKALTFAKPGIYEVTSVEVHKMNALITVK